MIGLLAPSAAAVLIAIAVRGARLGWPASTIHWWPLAVAALATELLLFNPPLDQQGWAMQAGPWIWVGSKLLLLAVVLRNARASSRTSPALLLAALGIALNALVIAANGGYMPQSTPAAISVWGEQHVTARRSEARLRNVMPMSSETRLPWLGDIVAQPAWVPRPNVISIGDIALALGIGGWVYLTLVPARRAPAV